MSRFQQAVAKARATREMIFASRALDSGSALAPEKVDLEEAWADLPQHRIDPDALARKRIVTASDLPEAAHFDILRTKLLATAREKGWRRIAITSPTPGCGKSTVALNLAFSLSRNRETRTVLLELDMRKPTLSELLDLQSAAHLAGFLAGAGTFEEHAVRYGRNLAISPCARPVRNPAELFHAPTADLALDDIAATYQPDLILCDLPPLMVGDDVISFAPKVDAVLIVAASEATTITQIDNCERELSEHCEVAGVILNKCHHMGDEYGYGAKGYA